MNRRLAERQNT